LNKVKKKNINVEVQFRIITISFSISASVEQTFMIAVNFGGNLLFENNFILGGLIL